MLIAQGQRLALTTLTHEMQITLTINIKSPLTLDCVCFGLDAQGRLSDDRYMVFFNQPASPCHSLSLSNGNEFSIDLARVPPTIERLVFSASVDGDGSLRDIQSSNFTVMHADQELATCPFNGATFAEEKAIMVVDIYRKNGEWRLAANLQGFNAGLAALVNHFGATVSETPASEPAKISLEKKIATAAPQLISLAKKAQVSLKKANLDSVKARVGLVLDASGSMHGQYAKGRVQEVINRLLPLAVHFDDDGALDCWAFGAKTCQLSPVTLSNYQHFVEQDNEGWRDWNVGRRINDEPKAMRQVIDYYQQSADRTPVYVLFISDGGVSENRAITQLMIEAAKLPIFWQFVGLGGRGYGVLEKLDDMPGRVVDNCSFFALDDLSDISEEQLYDQLMEEFPDWLKAATSAGILG